MLVNMKKATNREMLLSLTDPKGRRVVDIGCGDGALVRLMAKHGADATGVEPSPVQLAKALDEPVPPGGRFVAGDATALPFDDGSLDMVVFFNCLHHVPPESQAAALGEAARVVVPGGTVYVSEPLAEGPHFELMRPVHDETAVRAKAHDAIKNAAAHGLEQAREIHHVNPIPIRDFEAFRERTVRVNPETAPRFENHEDALREAFERLGTLEGEERVFDQPMRINMLIRKI